MAQQISVEFLEEKFMSIFVNDEGFKSCINIAKEMRKSEIIEARENGIIEGGRRMNNSYYGNWIESDKYYNETFKNETTI